MDEAAGLGIVGKLPLLLFGSAFIALTLICFALGVTAYGGLLDYAQLQPGQHVFVNGGTSSVGNLVIQLAKAIGCKVTASTSTKNIDTVKGLGADEASKMHVLWFIISLKIEIRYSIITHKANHISTTPITHPLPHFMSFTMLSETNPSICISTLRSIWHMEVYSSLWALKYLISPRFRRIHGDILRSSYNLSGWAG